MHLRCPHCQHAIELIAAETIENMTCPSCGSKFDFLGQDETCTYRVGEPKKVGHFELLDKVGHGHFGEVWSARDLELDRTVAVKIPRKEQLDDQDLRLFLREARSAAQLKHANIVAVHEVGRHGKSIYIVSDFIRGVSLSDWLQAHKPSPDEAARLCSTIADALHHAHQAGVIHRDLKPANVMLDGDSQPHVMDFGLAKREAGEITMTAEGKILGTPAYMSPEQARGEGHFADRRSDVYSLGVILYEMLAGQRPFSGTSQLLLHQVQHEEPRSPRKLNVAVSRDLETICLTAMAKSPEGRYPSAAAMAADLMRYLDRQPIHARPIGGLERGWRWSRRHPARAMAIFATAALVLMLAYEAHQAWQLPPGMRTVIIDATQPGARVSIVRLDEHNGVPLPGEVKLVKTTPAEVDLLAGEYLLVAEKEGFGFAEVYRHVPPEDEEIPGAHRHNFWSIVNGKVKLDPVIIVDSHEAEDGMRLIRGGHFRMGAAPIKPHAETVEDFWIDRTEVTVAAFRKAKGFVPKELQSMPGLTDRHPVAFVTYDMALDYAELTGRRLLTEEEYEFAATNRGRTPFPWGASPEQVTTWMYGPVGVDALDKLQIDPSVIGLYSNVAEWMDSWGFLGREGAKLPSSLIQQAKESRSVRGGPVTVTEHSPIIDYALAEWKSAARHNYAQLRHRQLAGLGFRCARSVGPRF